MQYLRKHKQHLTVLTTGWTLTAPVFSPLDLRVYNNMLGWKKKFEHYKPTFRLDSGSSKTPNNFSSVTFGQTSAEIVPHKFDIKFNCACSELPRMIGQRVHNSAIMHPTPQTSTDGPYILAPRSNSGGRYHNVTTRLVYLCTKIELG